MTEKAKKHARKLLNEFSLPELLKGIKTYGEVYQRDDTFFKYKWTLEEFLGRNNGCRVFIFKSPEDYLKHEDQYKPKTISLKGK